MSRRLYGSVGAAGASVYVASKPAVEGLTRSAALEIAGTGVRVNFAYAGIVETVETLAATPKHFDRTFHTNALGAYSTVQKALPLLNDGASIILNGSGAWQKGIPIYGVILPPRQPFALTSERGRQNSENVEFARTRLVKDQSRLLLSISTFPRRKLPTRCGSSSRRASPSVGWDVRKRALLRRFSWRQRRAASSPESTCPLMVGL
jgi:hypothetical protein